jgi:hypothetical protein
VAAAREPDRASHAAPPGPEPGAGPGEQPGQPAAGQRPQQTQQQTPPRQTPPADATSTPGDRRAEVVSLAAAAAARVAAGQAKRQEPGTGAAPDSATTPGSSVAAESGTAPAPRSAGAPTRPAHPVDAGRLVDAVVAAVPPPGPGAYLAAPGELPPRDAAELLRTCQVPAERLTDRANTSILVAALAQTVAVAAAWFASLRVLPRTIRPAAFLARTVTRLAFELVHDVTRGHRRVTIGTGAALVGVGLAGAIGTAGITSGLGVLVAMVGLVMVSLTSWRRLPAGLAVAGVGLLGVIAAAGVIPALHDRLFPWLSDHAVPYLADHPWAWAAVFGLLVLPPVWSVVEAVLTRRSRRDGH